MTRLEELLDPADLVIAIEDGLVRAKEHPTLPLTIYNYAEKAVYTRTWTDVTRQCRGLVVDHDGNVIARPWPKFFNHGEHPDGTLGLAEPVEVTDKADGSLGILVTYRGATLIATRGSFTSDQAQHATELYHERYVAQWQPDPSLTYLFEVVYPANRIVLDYHGIDDLILLGAVVTATGDILGPQDRMLDRWPGRRTPILPWATLGDALRAQPRPNAEGMVVRFIGTDLLVKLKQADYVALHRIVTGLNARVVWEHVGAGTFEQLLESLPDEFQQWGLDHAQRLNEAIDGVLRDAALTYLDVKKRVGIDDRAAFAAEAKRHGALTPLLFQLLDGKDITPTIHRSLRPSGDIVPRTFTEEAA